MPPDLTVSQVALVIIAVAVSVQSLLLIAAAWLVSRALKVAREEIDRRFDQLEIRFGIVANSALQMAGTVDRCAGQVSTILRQGERLSRAAGAVVTVPRALLVAAAASRVVAGWRRRRRERDSDGGGPDPHSKAHDARSKKKESVDE